MLIIPIWAYWLIVAAVFLILEICSATFFLFCFSIGAVFAGLAAVLELGSGYQWGAFVITTGISLFFSLKFLRFKERDDSNRAGVDRVIGEVGVVTASIGEPGTRGEVLVQHETWSALAVEDLRIQKGEKVTVEAVSGTHLIVSPVK